MITERVIRTLFPGPVVEIAKGVASGSAPVGRATYRESRQVNSLVTRFGSEERCRDYVEGLRWPDGVICLRCRQTDGISRIEKRGQFDCASCGYQFSVRVGTVFQNSHLPLWKWLLAAYIMGESASGVSANRLKQLLGVPYKTAWYLCHRIRAAMKDDTLGQVQDRSRPGRSPVRVKHLPRYLDEVAFRSSNRDNRYRFRDIVLRLIRAESISYTELIATA